MQAETRMLYKLIILYILDKVDFPMTNTKLTNYLLEKEYTNYFNIQETFSDLQDDEYMRCDLINNNYVYRITDLGRETLSFFSNTISVSIRDEIDLYIEEHAYELREEVSTIADFYEVKMGEYITRLQVVERGSAIIDLNLAVSSEEAAELICRQWRLKSSDVYAYVISTLMSNESV